MASDTRPSKQASEASAKEVLASEASAATSNVLLIGLDAITAALAPPLPKNTALPAAKAGGKAPSKSKAAAAKGAPSAKSKPKRVIRLERPPMPPAGTPEHTAARLLNCLRTIQQRSQRTRWQDHLLGLVHQWHAKAQETIGETNDGQAITSKRPKTPDVISVATARSLFWQPMHSNCWRKCETKSAAKHSTPESGASPERGSKGSALWAKVRSGAVTLPPVQAEVKNRRPPLGAGFRVLSNFRSPDARGPSNKITSSASDSKLLSLQGAVDVMKDGGLWPQSLGSSAATPPILPRSPSDLPPLKSTANSGHERSTDELPADYSLAEVTTEADGVAWMDSEMLQSEGAHMESTMELLQESNMEEGEGSPESQPQVLPRSKSAVEVFPRLARRKGFQSRRITFGTDEAGEVSVDKPVEVREIPKLSQASTPSSVAIEDLLAGTSKRMSGSSQGGFENTLTVKLEELAAYSQDNPFDDEEPVPTPGVKHPPRWTRKQVNLKKVESIGCGSRGFRSMGPSRFPNLYEDAAKVHATPQYAFLTSCTEARVLPRAPGSVVKAVADTPNDQQSPGAAIRRSSTRGSLGLGNRFSVANAAANLIANSKGLHLDVASYGVGDSGLKALGDSMERLGPVSVLNLEGNKLSSQAISEFLHLRMPPQGGCLKELNLSGNKTIDSGALDVLTHLLHDSKLRVMETLRLNEVNVPVRNWAPLMKSLLEAGSLKTLEVADTRLGFSQQAPVVAVAQLVEQGVLTSLDISGNFVQREGAEALVHALAETLHLTSLDISHNSGDHLSASKPALTPRPSRGAGPPEDGAGGEGEGVGPPLRGEMAIDLSELDTPPFSPLLMIIEGLLWNKTLRNLALVHCSLDYAADFLLAEALCRHPCLAELNLASNPHGVDGLGCLFRGMIKSPSRALLRMDVADLRENSVSVNAIKFNYANPSKVYILHLAHPQHRAVFRTILDLPKVDGKDSKSFCKDVEYHNGALLAGMWSMAQIQRDPETGIQKIPTDGILRFDYNAAMPSTPRGEKTQLGKAQDLHRRGRVALGLERSISLTTAYGTCRSDMQRTIFLEGVAESLVLKTAHVRLFVWHSPPTLGVQVVQLLFPAVGDLGETMTMDILRNRQEGMRARTDIRNLSLLNLRNPTGRYKLHLANPCDRACAIRLQALSAFERQLQISDGRPDVSQHGNYEPVRNVKHNGHGMLHGEVASFADLVVPSGGVLELDYASRVRARRPGAVAAKAKTPDDALAEVQSALQHSRASWLETLQVFRAVVADRLALMVQDIQNIVLLFANLAQEQVSVRSSSTADRQEGRHGAGKATFRPAHVEVLVACFGRCLEPTKFASAALVYDQHLFTPEEATELRVRLGSVNMFDWAHCGEENTNLPSGNRHSLDLTLNDDRQVAKYLVSVAKRESKEEGFQSFTECTWSVEKLVGHEWQTTWMTDIPKNGTFSCVFNDEEGVEVDVTTAWSARREFAEKVLGADAPAPPVRRLSS